MRIGKVSEKYHISVDNIYYYINYGLLVPPKPKGQYVFDEQTVRDLEWILGLKELDFSLREIHVILSLKRISGLADPQDMEELKEIFKGKRDFCMKEIERKQQVLERLDSHIKTIEASESTPRASTGVPLTALPLLCCPLCGGSLSLSEVKMDQRFIYKGSLSCSCGYSAHISSGILMTPNKNENLQDTPDITRELYKDLPPALISTFQRSYNWMLKQIEETDLHEKVIAETYINAWFFMQNHLEYLPTDSLYIVIDKYPETLLMYKHLIERQKPELDILYLADSSTRFPLKKNCIDVHLDFFAANEHNFYHDTFLFERIAPYLTAHADLIGTYFYFENAPKSMRLLLSQYPECFCMNFRLDYFLSSLKKAGFRLKGSEDCGAVTDSGNNLGFGFHVKGEKMHLMPYHASSAPNGQDISSGSDNTV